MGDLEIFGNVMDFVTAMAEVRKIYNEFKDISENETYSEKEREEAKQLTEGGIYKFLHRFQQINGGK